MKSSQMLAPLAGLVAVVAAGGYETTVIVTTYETYCPEPTTFSWYNATYTATSSDDIVTITNYPTTITYLPIPPITTTCVFPNTTETFTYPETTITYPETTLTYPDITYPGTTYPGVTITTYPGTTIDSTITTYPGTTTSTYPTNTPVPPPSTTTTTIPTAGAAKLGPVGALVAAGMVAMAL